jgi:hypothetical protein
VAVSACCIIPRRNTDLRMLINEAARVVDLVVDHQVKILLARMAGDVGVGEFLRHCDCRLFILCRRR